MSYKKFDKMPLGWQHDNSWGSPFCGYTPINNGKSVFNGGEKGLLKIKIQPKPQHEKKPKPAINHRPKAVDQKPVDYAKKMNDLARLKMKEQLIKDLTVDLTICQIEGWDYKEYVADLKKTIDNLYNSIVKNKKCNGAYKQPDLFYNEKTPTQ